MNNQKNNTNNSNIMENISFKSLVVQEIDGFFIPSFRQKSISELPNCDVTIKVAYSGLNYKDALSFRGHKGITKNYPHTPGIDASGVVVDTNSGQFQIGEKVLVTGYDLGMNTSGGFQQYIRVPSDWIVKLPKTLSLKQSMIYGTAGFTSALAIHRLQQIGIYPNSGNILVTGATGGVGILSISLLSKLGYKVEASTGKPEYAELLQEIGASKILSRQEVLDSSNRPLLQRRWKGVIENVGGVTLNSVIKQVDKGGAVVIIGNVTGDTFQSTVYPFLLRGVALLGVESAETSMELRTRLWEKLANEWKIDCFDKIHRTIQFDELIDDLRKMLNGTQSKKVVVEIDPSLD